jgi:hypothetical protein
VRSHKFELSKSDVKSLARKTNPVIITQPTKAGNIKTGKKLEKAKEGPFALAVKADTTQYPLDQRGADSNYAKAIRAARQEDKAQKAESRSQDMGKIW